MTTLIQPDLFDSIGETPPVPLPVPEDPAAIVDAIYAAYPRKEGKGAAREAIKKALKKNKVKAGDLLEAVCAYAEATKKWPVQDLGYIPHCATWINQERWEDDRSIWTRRNSAKGRAGFA
jgi:hypothetical protein